MKILDILVPVIIAYAPGPYKLIAVPFALLDAYLSRDPHLYTFDGLHYDFQTAGEFILSRQTSGGNFEVQARISAPIGVTSYSVITELGIQVGNDRVTIDSTRANVVWVNGVAATFTNGVDTLASGTITQKGSSYIVALNTGESVNAQIVSNGMQYGPGTTSQGINTTLSLNPFVELPGAVQGLLGNANGTASKDLTLADGTVLPTNMPASELYGAFADAWRVTQASSLLDYATGQTTQTFIDKNYPGTPITLASFPQTAIAAATALVQKMGITDPGLQQSAIYDYLVTGDPTILTTEANLQQQGITTAASADPALTTPGPEVGIIAAQASETEAASGATVVQFQVYRTGDTSAAATLSYAVTAPNNLYVGAASFGGTLPSGTIDFTAGQTSAVLPIMLSQGIGNVASAALQVQLTAPSPIDVIGPSAQVQIVNPAPIAGPPPVFSVELTSDESLLPTVSGDTWTFDVGPAGANGLNLAVGNAAAVGADLLSGTVTVTGDGAFTATTTAFTDLEPGAIFNVAQLTPSTTDVSGGTETLTFALQDTNSSGYALALPTETVVITDTPLCFLPGTLIATRSGETPVERLRVGDLVRTASGALRPIVWIGTGQVLATRGRRTAATPVIVRKGALAENVPHHDLRVTKGHSLYLDGALIPVEFLVNHRSIVWDDMAQEVTLYHVELETHDVLMANGAPAESYRDDGNRWLFRNANSDWDQPPKLPCAQVLTGGPVVDWVWRQLLDLCGPRLGVPLTDDPDVHLLVDGTRVDAVSRHGEAYIFPLSTRPLSVRVVSRSGSPAELGLMRDPRELGVAVWRIALRQGSRFCVVEAADALLAEGFHAFEAENDFRWTDGDAALPDRLFAGFDGPTELVLHIGGTTQYPLSGEPLRAEAA